MHSMSWSNISFSILHIAGVLSFDRQVKKGRTVFKFFRLTLSTPHLVVCWIKNTWQYLNPGMNVCLLLIIFPYVTACRALCHHIYMMRISILLFDFIYHDLRCSSTVSIPSSSTPAVHWYSLNTHYICEYCRCYYRCQEALTSLFP